MRIPQKKSAPELLRFGRDSVANYKCACIEVILKPYNNGRLYKVSKKLVNIYYNLPALHIFIKPYYNKTPPLALKKYFKFLKVNSSVYFFRPIKQSLYFKEEEKRIRETPAILVCADSSNNTVNYQLYDTFLIFKALFSHSFAFCGTFCYFFGTFWRKNYAQMPQVTEEYRIYIMQKYKLQEYRN